jgi:hypothetical protein
MPASLSEFSRRAETPSRSPIHPLLLATGTRTDTGRGAPQPHRQTPWPQPPDLHSEVCSNSSRHCAYVPPTSPVNGDRCPHARRYSLTASSLLSRCPFQAVGVTTVCYATVSLRTGGQHAQYGEVADGSRTETSLTAAAHESARPCPRFPLCGGGSSLDLGSTAGQSPASPRHKGPVRVTSRGDFDCPVVDLAPLVAAR